MLNRSASLAMSTSVLKALPGKLDIKRHPRSILYILALSFRRRGLIRLGSRGLGYIKMEKNVFNILDGDFEKFKRILGWFKIYRGSYMSAHVLLNLLNELGKRDKMRGLPSILSLFRNEFNKLNNTRARMLDSIYHMTNTLKSFFWRINVIILSLYTQCYYGRHNVSRKSINH